MRPCYSWVGLHLTRVNSPLASGSVTTPAARAGLLRPGRPHRPAGATCSTRSGSPRSSASGSVFLSERFNLKDAGVLAGAAAAATTRLGIATAATNHNTRHPLVTATMATTLHRLSGGRYALGLGRGFDLLFDVMGLPRVTGAQLEDAIGIYRRLWHGEAFGHDGPAGRYPYLSQDKQLRRGHPGADDGDRPEEPRAGRPGRRRRRAAHLLHRRDAGARRTHHPRAAPSAPARTRPAVRIWSVLATVEESIPEEQRLRKLVGRLATYLQGYGEVLVRANGWDLGGPRAVPHRRAGAGLPRAPSTPSAPSRSSATCATTCCRASGWPRRPPASAAECARRIQDQLDAGADSVVLHGATPTELAPVLAAWRDVRPDGLDRPARQPRPDAPRPATGRTAPAGRAPPRSPRPCGPTRAARSR